MGLQNSNWEHYFDESVYTLKIIQTITEQVRNEQGQLVQKKTKRQLKTKKCQTSDFNLDKEYFQNTYGIQQMYCIQDYDDIFIEGDYGASVYSLLQGHIQPCVNNSDSEVQCKSPEEIKKILNENYFAIYFTDTIGGRSLYTYSEQFQYKKIDYYFRNVNIKDNTGLIFENQETRRGFQFSNEKEFIRNNPLKSGEFLGFNIRFEKIKEMNIVRSYINLAEVLANIGGVMKVLLIFFAIISGYYSTQLYNYKLVNQIYDFKMEGIRNENITIQNTATNNPENDLAQQKQAENSNLKLEFYSFLEIFNCFWCCRKKKYYQQRQLLNLAKENLLKDLDIQAYLHLFQEIENFKSLFLNEKQQKLLKYLPKRCIVLSNNNKSACEKQFISDFSKNKDIENEDQKYDNSNNQLKTQTNQQNQENISNLNIITKKQNEHGIHSSYVAFQNILRSPNTLDQKMVTLIKLANLDQKFLNENSSDVQQNQQQKENSNIQINVDSEIFDINHEKIQNLNTQQELQHKNLDIFSSQAYHISQKLQNSIYQNSNQQKNFKYMNSISNLDKSSTLLKQDIKNFEKHYSFQEYEEDKEQNEEEEIDDLELKDNLEIQQSMIQQQTSALQTEKPKIPNENKECNSIPYFFYQDNNKFK